jgi:hydroxymethylglutaryl-CoA reductase
MGAAAGKVILLGEHAAVYGKHALALPIPDAVTATVKEVPAGLVLEVPDWGLSREISADAGGADAAVRRILENLGVARDGFVIRVRSSLPRAMGLGSSAAFAVAIVRAFDKLLSIVKSSRTVTHRVSITRWRPMPDRCSSATENRSGARHSNSPRPLR